MMLEVGDGGANLNGNERKSKALPQWDGNGNTSCIYPVYSRKHSQVYNIIYTRESKEAAG